MRTANAYYIQGIGAFYKGEECYISTIIECAYVLSCQIVVLLLYLTGAYTGMKASLLFTPFLIFFKRIGLQLIEDAQK